MRPILREVVAERIETLEAVDGLAGKVQETVLEVVPEGSALKDLLSGTWLGHPLHPMLTDVVIGCWLSSALLDLIPGGKTAAASDRLVALGILAALPTAAAGFADFSDLGGRTRRVATVHAAANVGALALMSLSLAGPATAPAKALEARVKAGRIEVRAASR
jgi:hypothetical protein